nr:S-layer homology domain-containing protein [uncultured Dysosmobacter sp.]
MGPYADAVAWAVSEGITSGTGATTFSPDADCTRAQIVTFLYRDAK